jgi:DNA polymerase I-like protein with 3'-5' exonuclease and polymerase domains
MITTLDLETTFTKDGDPSPFNPENKMVSVGINDKYYFFHHKDLYNIDVVGSKKAVQDILDASTLVIGHNLKFDMSWLYQCGFTYSGKLYDTMIGEYIINRGEKKSVSLKECCRRRNISLKSDVLGIYMDKGYNIDEIPVEQLRDYGIQDVKITKELYDSQMESFDNHANSGLIPTRDLMNDFLRVLIDMECNGNYVDLEELKAVEKELMKNIIN